MPCEVMGGQQPVGNAWFTWREGQIHADFEEAEMAYQQACEMVPQKVTMATHS